MNTVRNINLYFIDVSWISSLKFAGEIAGKMIHHTHTFKFSFLLPYSCVDRQHVQSLIQYVICDMPGDFTSFLTGP